MESANRVEVTRAPSSARRELRVPVDLPALLTYPESSSAIRVRVVDVSPSGLGLALPDEIAVGTGVTIDFAYGAGLGEIRYCLPKSGYYRAGVALQEFTPSRSRQTPNHVPPR